MVLMDSQVHLEQRVLPDLLDQLDQPDQLDKEDHQVSQVLTVNQDLRVSKEIKDQQDH